MSRAAPVAAVCDRRVGGFGGHGPPLQAVLLVASLLGAVMADARGATPAFFDGLRARAQLLAQKPYLADTRQIPAWLRDLSYDDYRIIEFDAVQSIWRREGLPFQVQFFHPGNLFRHVVNVSELRDGRVVSIPFRRDLFNYHSLKTRELPESLGFAGFRLLYPLNRPNDELGSFLGASYFRMLCERAAYGISARGLAVNTAEPMPEEFPRFTEFWIERPAPDAKTITLYALLDSESVTGAYRFIIAPGADTTMDVRAVLFCRKPVKVFGLAPLTSMFWRGENSKSNADDFRPEVHDSDGLLLRTAGDEWIWRPLTNPRAVRTMSFSDENPRGFGLLQRDRSFDHYQDIEAAYHIRPSAWVEPLGKWGRGQVRLVELPTPNEFNDNIVAFWVPEALPPAGEPLELEYRLHWFLDHIGPSVGQVVATRHARGLEHEAAIERFIVEFAGAELSGLAADAAVAPAIEVGRGAKLTYSTLQKNPFNDTWRVAFGLKPDGSGTPVELRCALRRSGRALTETWSYLWQP